MPPSPHPIAIFELSSSPHGQLVSFEPVADLVPLASQSSSAEGRCWLDGPDLACSVGAVEAVFLGAGRFCSAWSSTGLPTYLCAFHPGFDDGAVAMVLRWEPSRTPAGEPDCADHAPTI